MIRVAATRECSDGGGTAPVVGGAGSLGRAACLLCWRGRRAGLPGAEPPCGGPLGSPWSSVDHCAEMRLVSACTPAWLLEGNSKTSGAAQLGVHMACSAGAASVACYTARACLKGVGRLLIASKAPAASQGLLQHHTGTAHRTWGTVSMHAGTCMATHTRRAFLASQTSVKGGMGVYLHLQPN